MNDHLPRFRRDEFIPPSHAIDSDAPDSPSPAEAAAAILDALSQEEQEPPTESRMANLAQDLPLATAPAAVALGDPVSGFDDSLRVTAPEISPEGQLTEFAFRPFGLPEEGDLPEGINRYWYDESTPDVVDTASAAMFTEGLPAETSGADPVFAEIPAALPPEVLPDIPTFHAPTPAEMLVQTPVPADEPDDDIPMEILTLPNNAITASDLQDDVFAGLPAVPEEPVGEVIFPSEGEDENVESPVLEDVTPEASLTALPQTETEMEHIPTTPPAAQEPAPTPDDLSAPDFEALFSTQDEPAFTVAARYMETYRQNPSTDAGADALYWAAENYQKAGLPGKARGLYQDFIRQYPDHPNVVRAEQALQQIDMDIPTEDQLVRPTLNTLLADQLGATAAASAPTAIPVNFPAPEPEKPAYEMAPNTVVLPPYEAPVIEQPPRPGPPPGPVLVTQPVPVETPTTVVNPPEQAPTEEEIKKQKEDPTPHTGSVPLLVQFNKYLEKKDPRMRRAIYILAGLAVFLLALALLMLSRGLFSNKPSSYAQGAGSANSTALGTPQTGNGGTSPTSTGGGLVNPNGDNTSASQVFASPLEVSGGSDLNVAAGGWGWQFKYLEDKTELDRLAAAFRARGYRSGVIKNDDGKTGYRLIVGQFRTKDDAKAAKAKLPFDAPADVWVVDIK